MLRKILILFILMSCSAPNAKNELGSDSLNFDNTYANKSLFEDLSQNFYKLENSFNNLAKTPDFRRFPAQSLAG